MTDTLRDEQALRALVERYFSSVDRRDVPTLVQCFASDAEFSLYDRQVVANGREAIEREFEHVHDLPLSIHSLANAWIDVQGRKGVVHATAYLKQIDQDGATRILVRGLRYDDEYVQEDGQWRFQSRAHHPLWQYEAESVDPWTLR
jgi:ketosteroid isomerase-like protein